MGSVGRNFVLQDGSTDEFYFGNEVWKLFNDIRAFPLAVAAASFVLLSLHALYCGIYYSLNRKTEEEDGGGDGPGETRLEGLSTRLKAHTRIFGGYTIYGFMLARLFGSMALFYLSIITMRQCEKIEVGECPEAYFTISYVYAAMLAFVSVISKTWSTPTIAANLLTLLSALGVYGYRDLWPLAKYDGESADAAEGSVLWIKIVLLAFTTVFIPLFAPRRYIPVDLENPTIPPNPEQTSSIFSMMTYTFLDPVIVMGYKVPHLPADQLPPLNDRDGAKYLTGWAFKHLDILSGAQRHSMFLRLMRIFRLEYSILALTICGYSLGSFASPIGMYQILFFLETRGAGAVIRPWFWIMWLIVGPTVQSFSFQWYSFIATRTFVRTEALLTQLVFEHSLRIRLKAEAATDAKRTPEVDAMVLRTESEASIVTASVSTSSDVSDVASGSGSARQSSEVSTVVPSGEPCKVGSDTAFKVSTDRKPKEAKEKQKEYSRMSDGNLIGKINNLITTDLNNITPGGDFLMIVLYIPLQITLCLTFLYRVLGWSAFVGFAVMLVLLPIPGYVAAKLRQVQKDKMKKTDARVQSVAEAVNVIRMVKLFGWEAKMTGSLREKREDELKLLWKTKLLDTGARLLGYIFPTITMMATYSFYTVVMKQELTASKIFSSMTVFASLREQLQRLLVQAGTVIQAKVSLDRIDDFLHQTELLDAFMDTSTHPSELFAPALGSNLDIGFKNAAFSWSPEEHDGATTPSSRMFKLRIEEQLLFKRNCVNLIVGPTGSGKTSMLMALLGEMHFIPTDPDSWFNLPREGGVAYAAQESWVQNETIKNNILFGSAYDEKRYHKVIKQCALERDLELFESGDSTEVGERGLTLSGGQKARLTLARAIYSSAEIILLDDVLAALDVHTSAWIVEKCLQGDLVSGRTIILVTHNVALASPIAHFIVSIGSNGCVRTQGTALSAAITRDPTLAAEAKRDEEVTRIRQEDIPAEPKKLSEGKLIVAEEIVEGHITWRSLKLLLDSLGGGHPILFLVICVLALLLNKWSITFQTWFLGYWGSQYETRPASEVNLPYYLTIYTTIFLASFLMYGATYLFYLYGTMRASRVINNRLMDSVFGGTLRWLDETPTGRIITRCTQDIRAIDGPVPQMFVLLLDFACGIVTRLGAIVLFTPLFILPGVGVAIFGLYLGNMYLKAQLSVKREASNARSPMLAHFSAAIHGIVSLRAYGAQTAFKDESLRRIDHYARVARMSYNLNRWMGVRMDALGAAFTAALAAYLVYGPTAGAGNTGFSLNMAVEFGLYIRFFIRIFNDFEVQANSLERIQGYIDIEHEPTPTEGGKPPAAWPTTGGLHVEKLSVRYSVNGPMVLHDISFQIDSGQRIGVVGRTGSGKSSLTLALLRCIFTEGTVYFDGIPTNTINLDALRSSITIIPQIPELLSGSLRQNLDPFDQYDDTTLNGALRAAGLFSLQEDEGEANLTLDSNIAGGGGNLSVGQRQIIALARAMVRGSKLLILDEATSAIDYKTDAIIQSTLRSQLGDDVSVITIAHRLQTIMDADKIMVLDNGRIAEFDSPKELLQNEQGMLRALVDGSGNRKVLFELAGSKS